MSRKDGKFLMEVSYSFDPDTYLAVARRIIALIGRQYFGSNRVMAFSFRTEEQRSNAMANLPQGTVVHGCAVSAHRVETSEVTVPHNERAWTCTCGYQSFLLRGDGAIVCWTCNKVQDRVAIKDTP